jgi:hypothetical protein
MKKIFFTPTRSEALALGEYQFSSDQGETVLRPFAPPLTFVDSLRYIQRFATLERFDITFWLNGSRVRSSWYVNLFLTFCNQMLFLVRALNRWRTRRTLAVREVCSE